MPLSYSKFVNILLEGGNIFDRTELDRTEPIPKKYVNSIVNTLESAIPDVKLQRNIGSAGFKLVSGDIDLFLDADSVMEKTKTNNEKDARKGLAKFLKDLGFDTALSGRNVHVKVAYFNDKKEQKWGQVDLMVIKDAERVAPWHQHGPRGLYKNPEFKGAKVFILLSSIAKYLDLKLDTFSGNLRKRSDDTIVANTRESVAKILLNPGATDKDLNSTETILKALQKDPHREEKLSQYNKENDDQNL